MAALAAMAVAVCAGRAAGEDFLIAPGRAVVNGTLDAGEWDSAAWVELDQIYYGEPSDLTNAQWAAFWDHRENVIYVAVTATDLDHVMHEWTAWNGQDAIEVYINARNDDVENYDDMNTHRFDYAQQYVVGYDPATTSVWAVLGGGIAMPSNTLAGVAFGIQGDRLVYELKIRPYDRFDYDAVTNSTEVSLRPALTLGLDVVLNSRRSDGFGMLCENLQGGKFNRAAAMRDYTLTGRLPSILRVARLTHARRGAGPQY